MLAQMLNWFVGNTKVKVGTGILGGGGFITLILFLHSDVTAKIMAEKTNRKEYVNLVLKPLHTEISNLKEDIKTTKGMVRDIHNYLLNKK